MSSLALCRVLTASLRCSKKKPGEGATAGRRGWGLIEQVRRSVGQSEGDLLEWVCARECACVRACARVFTHQRPCLLGGVSGRGLLLGEGSCTARVAK